MGVTIYTDGISYYTEVEGPGSVSRLHWIREGEGQWSAKEAQRPAEFRETRFADIPGDLQEELLAFAARAKAIGTSSWDFKN